MRLVVFLFLSTVALALASDKEKYVKPTTDGNGKIYFEETFDEDVIGSKWIKSNAKKDGVDENIAKYDGKWSIEASKDSELDGDKGLVVKSKAKHHAIAAKLNEPFEFTDNKPLVVQYEVKFQQPLECGGAYIKLLRSDSAKNLEQFTDKTGYTIMFGPDKCSSDKKLHFIVQYLNKNKNVYEEKHAKKIAVQDNVFNDGRTHLYTLILSPDHTYRILVDNEEVSNGNILNDMTPPLFPPKEIPDPEDKKPEDWDEREKIVDENAEKPEDWDENEPEFVLDTDKTKPENWLEDEPLMIPDPNAVKPEDWDDETDGEWEAPKIDNPICKENGCGKWTPPNKKNPLYKGKWMKPLIDNPSYKGKWEPRIIANPDFYEEAEPFKQIASISAVGLELWTMTDEIYFDNFLITDNENTAKHFADNSFIFKKSYVPKKEDKKDEPEDNSNNGKEEGEEEAEEEEQQNKDKDEL